MGQSVIVVLNLLSKDSVVYNPDSEAMPNIWSQASVAAPPLDAGAIKDSSWVQPLLPVSVFKWEWGL